MSAYPTAKPAVTRAALICGLQTTLALVIGGCAETQPYYAEAPAVAAYVAEAPAEVEGDGLPTQAAPPMRIRGSADDPSQPFSPNYGGKNPSAEKPESASRQAEMETPKAYIPTDLPPAFRRQLAASLDTAG